VRAGAAEILPGRDEGPKRWQGDLARPLRVSCPRFERGGWRLEEILSGQLNGFDTGTAIKEEEGGVKWAALGHQGPKGMYSLFHTVRQIFAEEVIYGSGLKQIAVGFVV